MKIKSLIAWPKEKIVYTLATFANINKNAEDNLLKLQKDELLQYLKLECWHHCNYVLNQNIKMNEMNDNFMLDIIHSKGIL